MAPPIDDDGIATLRRWTVAVVLGLLVLVVLVDVLDALFGEGTFQVDAGFYGLVGGVIVGLFGAGVVEVLRHRGD